MRKYLKKILIVAISFYITYSLIDAIVIGPDPKNIPLVVGGLVMIFLLIDPIFSLVLLPLNHMTFGLLLFILNIAFIFGLLNFLPGFSVVPYSFPGLIIDGYALPAHSFSQIATIVLVASTITVIQKILHIIFD